MNKKLNISHTAYPADPCKSFQHWQKHIAVMRLVFDIKNIQRRQKRILKLKAPTSVDGAIARAGVICSLAMDSQRLFIQVQKVRSEPIPKYPKGGLINPATFTGAIRNNLVEEIAKLRSH